MAYKKMTGRIICARGEFDGADPHSFDIEGDDGGKYFAHLADIEANVYKLYKNTNQPTVFLKENDRVEFEIPQEDLPRKRVIHVKKSP